MTGPTRILLVRHGQSEWNLSGRWQGQADPPLTDLGRAQARSAAQVLGTVDAIWSSDLQRAVETATIIAGELGVGPVVAEPGLRERDAGEWSGLTRAEIDERYPGYLEPLDGEDPEGWVPRRPPGWESDAALATRVHRVLRLIRREVGTGEVLTVTHAGLIYTVERELGAAGGRLGNLDGRWLELLPAIDDLPVDDGAGDGDGREGDLIDGAALQLADIARLGDRLSLLSPEQLTVPEQI